jgi:hypothetical protein
VLEVARSANDVKMNCPGGDCGLAWARVGDYGHADVETFSWGEWFFDTYDQLDLAICAPGDEPPGCRFAPYPWPYHQGAEAAWHEVMPPRGAWVPGVDECSSGDVHRSG